MSLRTVSATTVLPEPMTVTAQHVPSALMELDVPLTISVASLQSTVCSTPSPVMWVSPFLAAAEGTPANNVKPTAIAHAADVRPRVVHVTAAPLAMAGDLLEESLRASPRVMAAFPHLSTRV